MAELFRITAVPTLYNQGEYAGKLKSVTFTAVSATETRQWFARNCGQFESAFTRIMPAAEASALVAALLRGEAAELPGAYQKHQFDSGFLYEWTPIYLVLPPICFFGAKQPA